jgi:hypothetical protein
MRIIVGRALLPAMLVAAGIAAVVYGARFHQAPVIEEQEREFTIKIPLPGGAFLPPADSPMPDPVAQAGGDQDSQGGEEFITRKIKKMVAVSGDNGEPRLIRDLSVGGIVRLDSGELKRTYSGEAPSLCPS